MRMVKNWGKGVRKGAATVGMVIAMTMPAEAVEADPMVVFVDHATVLRLAKPAMRVIVGNPAIADVNVDSPKLISIFGKSVGETNLIVLGAADQTLLSRPVIVTGQPDHAVAVHAPGKDGPTSRLYSCVDGRCSQLRSAEGAGALAGASSSTSRPLSTDGPSGSTGVVPSQ